MNRKRRIVSLFLVFAMLATLAPWSSVISSASYSGTFQFDSEGKFTVMQLADIQDDQNVDGRVITMITKAIAKYSPDLIVFSGDNVAPGTLETFFEDSVDDFLAPLLNTNTKFAITFGNHDDEGISPSKSTQYAYYMSKGGSNFVDHDVSSLDGVGSGVIPIYPNGQSSGTPAFQIFLMDSGNSASSGYDCPYTSQIDYYIQRSLAYPSAASLWFQHIVVPDIYTETMTQVASGTANSFSGNGSPYSSYTWALNPARIAWDKCGDKTIPELIEEGPCPANESTYTSSGHLSSSAYGNKTLYQAWSSYGNMKGAYFGHDHMNSFVTTTDEGIDLGYCKGATLSSYNDGNPGLRIYELDESGTYTSEPVTESDLNVQIVDPTAPTGTVRMTVKTKSNDFPYTNAYGTDDDVYLDLFYTDGTSWSGYVDDTGDSNDFEMGDNNTCTFTSVPIKPVSYMNLRDTYSPGDDWTISNSYVYFNVNGTEVQVGSYTSEHKFSGPGSVTYNPNPTTWFADNSHTLTFNGNGGSPASTVIQCVYGATLQAVNIPTVTRIGYVFTGWSPAVPITGPDADTTYTAQWSSTSYDISFDGNGSTEGSMAAQSIAFGQSAALHSNEFSRTGYTFAGWGASPKASVSYLDGANYTMATQGATLYAIWDINSYTVNFNANGGTGSISPVTQEYSSNVVLPATGFTKAGYNFIGWNTSPSATTALSSYTVPANNATLYAIYTMGSYTVSFDANGGTGIASPITQNYGTSVALPTIGFAKTGYTFIGWNTSPSASTALSSYTVPGTNVTLYAIYTVNSYSISFDTAGGAAISPITQNYGTPVTALADPSKTGYTFTGWSPSIPDTIPDYNITCVAQWSANSYDVTFNGNGSTGGSMLNQSIVFDRSAILTSNSFSKTGYSFAGWASTPGGSVLYADNASYTMNTAGVTLYAKWVPNSYTVAYDGNGSTAGATASSVHTYGTAKALTANGFGRTGYVFAGWALASNGTVVYTDGQSVTNLAESGTVTLYAKWAPNSYTVVYDGNGSTSGSTADSFHFYDTASALTQNGFEKTGYLFAGWATAPNGEILYSDGQNATNLALGGTVTFYAKWTPITYQVTYDANGGTGTTANSSHTYDTASNLTENGFVKTGFSFLGWSTSSVSTVPEYSNGQSVLNLTDINAGNVTFYSVWSVNQYNVSFDANGGTGAALALSQDYGTSVMLPSTGFTKAGYTFIGWNTSSNATTALSSYTVPAYDSTLYAVYASLQYKVTFNKNGGSGYAPAVTQDYNSSVVLPSANFSKTGCTFIGWNTTSTAVTALSSYNVPAHDSILYAIYIPNQYTVTFDANGGTGGTSGLMAYGSVLTAPTVSRTGYTFTGWSPSVPATVILGGATYTAQWSINSYTITFDANGGTGGTSGLMTYGTALAAPAVSRAGYILTGWSPAVPATVGVESAVYTALWMLLGNVNNDSVINSLDALMALKATSGKIALTDSQKSAADVNKDGKVNSLDALMILRFTSGKIISF